MAFFLQKADSLIKIKGVNIWQNAVDNCVLNHPQALEYKAEVFVDGKGREQVGVYVEFHEGISDTTKEQSIAQISEGLRDNTGINFLVSEWKGAPIFEQRDKTSQQKVRRWEDRRYKTGGVK